MFIFNLENYLVSKGSIFFDFGHYSWDFYSVVIYDDW